eukprot:scaffold46533_cov66-Phaeocystis_antarctica.AAC.3
MLWGGRGSPGHFLVVHGPPTAREGYLRDVLYPRATVSGICESSLRRLESGLRCTAFVAACTACGAARRPQCLPRWGARPPSPRSPQRSLARGAAAARRASTPSSTETDSRSQRRRHPGRLHTPSLDHLRRRSTACGGRRHASLESRAHWQAGTPTLGLAPLGVVGAGASGASGRSSPGPAVGSSCAAAGIAATLVAGAAAVTALPPEGVGTPPGDARALPQMRGTGVRGAGEARMLGDCRSSGPSLRAAESRPARSAATAAAPPRWAALRAPPLAAPRPEASSSSPLVLCAGTAASARPAGSRASGAPLLPRDAPR